MNKFFGAIVHYFRNIEIFVSDTFTKIFGPEAAHNFGVAALALLETELGKIATTVVQEVEALAKGADKRAAAFEKITSAAWAAGIEAKGSIVNMLIEVAVQRMKGMFGPVSLDSTGVSDARVAQPSN